MSTRQPATDFSKVMRGNQAGDIDDTPRTSDLHIENAARTDRLDLVDADSLAGFIHVQALVEGLECNTARGGEFGGAPADDTDVVSPVVERCVMTQHWRACQHRGNP